MRTSGTHFAANLPTLALALPTLVITDLLTKAHLYHGINLHDSAQEALHLFPILVLGPQRPGALSSSVKTEVASRLNL
jgi:hypothetical protein